MNELSVDELIELSTRTPPEVFTQLSTITATAAEGGVEATVDLDGRLVALTLTPQALAAGPAGLAAGIFRLVQEASARALNTGIEILTPAAGEDLAAELRALVFPAPTTPARARPGDPVVEEDFSTIETWAVPR